jgi:hypothetical protein
MKKIPRSRYENLTLFGYLLTFCAALWLGAHLTRKQIQTNCLIFGEAKLLDKRVNCSAKD